eukprot:205121-Pyramimonas_sp.AAC.1
MPPGDHASAPQESHRRKDLSVSAPSSTVFIVKSEAISKPPWSQQHGFLGRRHQRQLRPSGCASPRAFPRAGCLEGVSSVVVHYDMKKLFDTVAPARLARLARALRFPPHVLHVGLLVHAAPRALESNGFCPQVIPAGIGVLPGCVQSTSWVNIYLYQTLSDLHNRYLFCEPRVATRSYVSDISQICQADEIQFRRQVAAAAAQFGQATQAAELVLSTEPAVISNPRSL